MPIGDTSEQRDSERAKQEPVYEADETRKARQSGQERRSSPTEGEREQREARESNEYTGTPGAALGPENESLVDEASAESFPASDPPAWTRDKS